MGAGVDTVDDEAGELVDRRDGGRVEFDHRVVEAAIGGGHGAQGAKAFGALGNDRGARPRRGARR